MINRTPICRRSLLAAAGALAWVPRTTLRATTKGEESLLGSFAGEIWDIHGHLTGLSGTPEDRVDRILVCADRMGIERLMLCMGLKFNTDPTPEEMQIDNDVVLKAIEHAPERVFGFVYLNPQYPVECLRELDRCVMNGPMIGVKLWMSMRCNHRNLDAIVRRATSLGVPILQHVYQRTTKNKDGESSPADLSVLANRHPEAVFIAAHTGNDWEKGIREIRANANVFCEICGSDPTSGMVEMAVRELGADRVLYGSDIPGRSFASQLAKVVGANITKESKRMILIENTKLLLSPKGSRKE